MSLAKFGPFADVFAKGELVVPGYLELLSLNRTATQIVIDRIERAMSHDDPCPWVTALFADPNWRPHCAALDRGAVTVFRDITFLAAGPANEPKPWASQMLFIHPMWDHESQRIGKRKCTPTGYALHVIGEMIGFLGLLLLFVVPAVLVRQWWTSTFEASLFWLFAVPFGLGVVSEVLVQFSWWLALRKGFKYDCERCAASWIEAGERRTYKYPGLTND